MDFSEFFYIDASSPTGLRNKCNRYGGKDGKSPVAVAGEIAGCIGPDGYAVVSLKTQLYKVAHVVWFITKGPIPEGCVIDHIDGMRCNNAPSNLRAVPQKLNARNKVFSGLAGVHRKVMNKKGKDYIYWRTCWTELDGTRKSKDFSVLKLGEHRAECLAKACRLEQILRLNAEGAGYSDRHIGDLL